jgi:ABC-type dipeptide/oligopeptide/nickel transport system permease subunit
VGDFISTETSLSALGLGVKWPHPDPGLLVVTGAAHLDFNPLEALAPTAVLGVLIVGFTFLGDGLRDALDPRSTQ